MIWYRFVTNFTPTNLESIRFETNSGILVCYAPDGTPFQSSAEKHRLIGEQQDLIDEQQCLLDQKDELLAEQEKLIARFRAMLTSANVPIPDQFA